MVNINLLVSESVPPADCLFKLQMEKHKISFYPNYIFKYLQLIPVKRC